VPGGIYSHPIGLPNIAPVPSVALSNIAPAPISLATAQVEDAGKVTQVSYTIDIIADHHGCMKEFAPLRDGQGMMFAESRTLLPALRIMQKHGLIREISSPKLVATAGQKAQLEVGRTTATEEGESWDGVRLEVAAREMANALNVQLAVHTSEAQRRCEVQTAVLVEAGQTVVLNTKAMSGQPAEESEREHPVYVIVTPEVIK
jgi:hypothetical protein